MNLKQRIFTLFDNVLGNVLANLVCAVLLAIVAGVVTFYSSNPLLALLWFLFAMSVVTGMFTSLTYFVLRRSRTTQVHMRHRDVTTKEFEDAFKTGAELFMLSIMSQHTIKDMDRRLQDAQKSRTRVNVLSLDPSLRSDSDVVNAITFHLNEPPNDSEITTRQIREAWKQWVVFRDKYSDVVKIRKYCSIPTMQGILVRDRYILVELIPYDTRTESRPGLFLTHEADRELFSLFQEKFIALWVASERDVL